MSLPPSPCPIHTRSERGVVAHLGPLGAHLLHALPDVNVLLGGPVALVELRPQVVAPPLAALLAVPVVELRGNLRPRLDAVDLDKLAEMVVFLGPPRAALGRCVVVSKLLVHQLR